jgi:hypothetical protein
MEKKVEELAREQIGVSPTAKACLWSDGKKGLHKPQQLDDKHAIGFSMLLLTDKQMSVL